MVSLSIPSPPPDSAWQIPITIPIGQWLSWAGLDPATTISIHTYALCIIAGIIAAIAITNWRLTRRGAEPWVIVDIAIWAVVLGIIGARLYHVLTHPDDYFDNGLSGWEWFQNLIDITKGGNAIFGSLIGGALGIWIACRITGLRFLSVADALAPGLLVAQALGRLGNYFNQELFGWPTDLPWGLEINRPNAAIPNGLADDVLFHPTFLYELLWNLLGAAVILLIENRVSFVAGRPSFARRPFWQWGKVIGLYFIWYGVGRSVFETIRLDPSETLLGIRTNVWAAFAAIVLGVIIIAVQTRRHPGIEPSVYRPGHEWTAASALDSDDTYTDVDDPSDEAEAASETAATSPAASPK